MKLEILIAVGRALQVLTLAGRKDSPGGKRITPGETRDIVLAVVDAVLAVVGASREDVARWL